MSNDHHVSALVGTIASWLLFAGSLAVQAIPYLQFLSLVLACAASIFAIKFYRRKT